VIVRFVDIDGIDDHHSFNLFSRRIKRRRRIIIIKIIRRNGAKTISLLNFAWET
jgi:hypothetical protein